MITALAFIEEKLQENPMSNGKLVTFLLAALT